MIRIEKILEIIEQEHKVLQVHNASQLGTVEASCDLEDIVISGGTEHFSPRNSNIIFCFAIFQQTLQIVHETDKSNLMGLVKQDFQYMQNVLIILIEVLKLHFILFYIS